MLKVSKTLSKSTEVMQLVNNLIKLPELQRSMVDMSKGEEQTVHTCGVWRCVMRSGSMLPG